MYEKINCSKSKITFRKCEFSHPEVTYLSDVQISFPRLTKVGVTSKFWLKLTDVKRHCRKIGHLSTT